MFNKITYNSEVVFTVLMLNRKTLKFGGGIHVPNVQQNHIIILRWYSQS